MQNSSIITLLIISIYLLFTNKVSGQEVDDIKVSLGLRNASLIEAFNKIEEQSEFHFMYRKEDVRKVKNINISSKNESVGNILRMILLHTPLHFKQVNKQILIKNRTAYRHSSHSLNFRLKLSNGFRYNDIMC